MFLPAVITFSLLAPPGPGTPPREPAREVVVAEPMLSVPPLPEHAEQARRENRRLQATLRAGIADIEQNLAASYSHLAQETNLDATLSVPRERAEEAHFLASMLDDRVYVEQEARFLAAWNGWQAALVGAAVAAPAGPPASASNEQAAKTAAVAQAQRHTAQSDVLAGIDYQQVVAAATRQTKGGPVVNWESVQFDTANHAEDQQRVQAARVRATVVQKQAPELAEAWSPLAEHLNACAIRFMDYERTPVTSDSPSMRALRLQAKIGFLEHYRKAMWCCAVVWAQSASADPPPGLKKLP